MTSGDASAPTTSGLQGELDALAVALGRSVSLDDLEGTLIGYSIQGRDVDNARVEAILSRRVPAAVLDYQRSFGVDEATGPVRVPANPALQMGARTCLPVRQRRDVLALLWVLDDEKPLDRVATRTARACAERLRTLLSAPEPIDPERLLGRLFGDDEPPDPTDLLRHARKQLIACCSSSSSASARPRGAPPQRRHRSAVPRRSWRTRRPEAAAWS